MSTSMTIPHRLYAAAVYDGASDRRGSRPGGRTMILEMERPSASGQPEGARRGRPGSRSAGVLHWSTAWRLH
jgi:hypothetical protein